MPIVQDSIALRASQPSDELIRCNLGDLTWQITAEGPMYGAILVERMRTYGGRLLDLSFHTERLQAGARAFRFCPDSVHHTFLRVAEELLVSNREIIHQCGDVSIVILFSPKEDQWECIGHLSVLPFSKLAKWYAHGMDLFTTSVRAISSDTIPTEIKHRSRFNYWLADRHVKSIDPDGLALLETSRGFLADTSIANLIVVNPENVLLTPSKLEAHQGTTLKRIQQLVSSTGNSPIVEKSLTHSDLFTANEVILVGTSGGVWEARSLDSIPLGRNRERPILRRLQANWRSYTGFDFISQASVASSVQEKRL